jgi:serine phosphatase RsbU (regulator of sigma subunit)
LIANAQMHEHALRQREIEQDLKLATDVQRAFLPQAAPDIAGFEVESFYQAANHIGGDYFDYIHLSDGKVAVVVADVVGHGVAAAMFMAKLSAETRFCLAGEPDISKAVARLNDRMSALEVERFVTFLLLVLDPVSDSVTLVNAGHMPPILRRSESGELYEPGRDQSGLPIGIDSGMDYEAVTVNVAPGDLILMYTDGINEAMDANDAEFGIEAIRRLAVDGESDGQPGGAVKDRIVGAVLDHVGEVTPFDDMCLVVIRRTDPGSGGVAAQTRAAAQTPKSDTIGTS